MFTVAVFWIMWFLKGQVVDQFPQFQWQIKKAKLGAVYPEHMQQIRHRESLS
jgi:hypothetical protein